MKFNHVGLLSPRHREGLISLGVVTNSDTDDRAYDLATKDFVTPYSNNPTKKVDRVGDVLGFNENNTRNTEALTLSHLGNTLYDGATKCSLGVLAKYTGTSTSTNEDCLIGQWSNLQGSVTVPSVRVFIRYDSNASQIDFSLWNGSSATTLTVAVSIDDGEYHWIVGDWSGPTMRLYVDGVQQGGTASFTGPIGSASHAKVPEVMGGHQATGSSTVDAPRFDLKSWFIYEKSLGFGPHNNFKTPLSGLDYLIETPSRESSGIVVALGSPTYEATPGAIKLTGINADLKQEFFYESQTSNIPLTGQTADVVITETIPYEATPGAIKLLGQTADYLETILSWEATPGNIQLTGVKADSVITGIAVEATPGGVKRSRYPRRIQVYGKRYTVRSEYDERKLLERLIAEEQARLERAQEKDLPKQVKKSRIRIKRTKQRIQQLEDPMNELYQMDEELLLLVASDPWL